MARGDTDVTRHDGEKPGGWRSAERKPSKAKDRTLIARYLQRNLADGEPTLQQRGHSPLNDLNASTSVAGINGISHPRATILSLGVRLIKAAARCSRWLLGR